MARVGILPASQQPGTEAIDDDVSRTCGQGESDAAVLALFSTSGFSSRVQGDRSKFSTSSGVAKPISVHLLLNAGPNTLNDQIVPERNTPETQMNLTSGGHSYLLYPKSHSPP
ncbi:hypothetical protein MRX96_031776 [Rhipicephalus microplus]